MVVVVGMMLMQHVTRISTDGIDQREYGDRCKEALNDE